MTASRGEREAGALDPSDKNGEKPTIHLPSGKTYTGEWYKNKITGASSSPREAVILVP